MKHWLSRMKGKIKPNVHTILHLYISSTKVNKEKINFESSFLENFKAKHIAKNLK